MTNPKHTDTSRSGDLVKRLRKQAYFADRSAEDAFNEAADRIEALEAEVEGLREELADAYIKLSGKSIHTSDCATSSAPAMKPGPCDCAALGEKQ